MSAQHTPTPWTAEKNGGKGAWIAGADGEWSALSCGTDNENADANAEFIVRACNAHDDLVMALRLVEKGMRAGSIKDASILLPIDPGASEGEVTSLSAIVRAALAKSEPR